MHRVNNGLPCGSLRRMRAVDEKLIITKIFFFPGLDVMPFPTTPSTKGKRAGQELKIGTSKSP